MEKLFEKILNAVQDVMIFYFENKNLIIKWANKSVTDFFNKTLEQIIGTPCYRLWHERNRPCDGCPVIKVFETGKSKETERTTQDGKIWEIKAIPLKEENKINVIGLARDITVCRQDQMTLQESEKKFRMLANNRLVGVYLIQDWVFKFANETLARMFGYTVDELIGKPYLELVYPDDRGLSATLMQKRITGELEEARYQFRGLRKDGSWFYCEVLGHRIEYQGKPAVQGVLLDITEQKRLEEQLLHAQKMEAIGRLAGGIAHDFNNLLTIIMGNLQIAQLSLPSDSPIQNHLESINKAVERAVSLTQKLLTFSRKQLIEPRAIDLNEIVKGMEKMLKRLIGEDIELITAFEKDIPLIKADPIQIEQVIINLAVNARDAMPEGGKLIIKIAKATFREKFQRKYPEIEPGDYVMLSISDTGIGMDEETLSHIFEPFFTTKEAGKGTGLGLSTVYGIVKQTGGYIYVYSQPGKGTTFEIYFPILQKMPVVEKESAMEFHLPSIKATILVVEDEEEIRNLLREMLEHLGYEVIIAETGIKALRLFDKYKDKINLIITDVVMPQISGKELVEKIKKEYPEIKVLYMSGYPENVIAHYGVLEEDINFISKPFTLMELTKKLKKIFNV